MRPLIPTVLALLVLVSVAGAESLTAHGKILQIRPKAGGAILLVQATTPNPEGLGKFVANVSLSTRIRRLIMCQPPKPAKIGDLRIGQSVAVTFVTVIETMPPQVDATMVTILGYPHTTPLKPQGIALVEGTIKNVAMAKVTPFLPHAGTGFIVLAGEPADLMGYSKLIVKITRDTKLYVPGPDCGPMEVGLHALQVGQRASAKIKLPISKSLPAQATGMEVYAGFR